MLLRAPIGAAMLTCFIVGHAVSAQAPPRPAFDLADVRQSPRGVSTASRGPLFRSGRYEVRRTTLLSLIGTAYGVPTDKIVGGPGWLDFDRFDIVAKAPPEASRDTLNLMLQSLLVERFNLAVRQDDVPRPQFTLRVGKGKPRLKPGSGSAGTRCRSTTVPGTVIQEFHCQNITMAAFAEQLRAMGGSYFDAPVVDATGLTGSWDFDLTFPPASAQAATRDGDTVFTAVEKLGLELKREAVPTAAFVVDRVNPRPAANPPGAAEALAPGPVSFEVATIKPIAEGANAGNRISIPQGGQVNLRGTLRDLMAFAWDTGSESVVGGPPFVGTDRFELTALVSSSVSRPVDAEVVRPMMRALLKERFGLQVHEGEQPIDVYALVKERGDVKMKRGTEAERGSCKSTPEKIPANSGFSAAVTCWNITMPQFASVLRGWAPNYIDRQVVDASGASGAWDFTFFWTGLGQINGRVNAGQPGDRAEALAEAGTLTVFQSIERYLGLKLNLQKHPMPVLIIDRVEPKPTEN